MDTTDIRAALTAIQSQIVIIESKCDIIDAHECEEPIDPEEPTLPVPVNCLAGTNPGSISMITAEQNETPWINLRNTHLTQLASVPNGSIIMIGDSQIANMNVSLVSPYAWNGGISGESSRQLIYRLLNDTLLRTKAQNAGALVIETFVNDLGDNLTYSSQQNCLDTVIPFMLPKIANWVSGKTVLICPTKVDSGKGFWTNNTTIETFNTALKNAAAGKTGVRVIDINPTIAPNNTLLPQYDSGDGHHLNAAGMQLKANAIKAALIDLGLTAENLAP